VERLSRDFDLFNCGSSRVDRTGYTEKLRRHNSSRSDDSNHTSNINKHIFDIVSFSGIFAKAPNGMYLTAA
jgi:hypothetical protein